MPFYRSKGALHERNHKHHRRQLVCAHLPFFPCRRFPFSPSPLFSFFFALSCSALLIGFKNTTTPFLAVVWNYQARLPADCSHSGLNILFSFFTFSTQTPSVKEMSRASFVSILNNDDNPAFAVRSAYGIPKHYPTSSQHYSLEPPARVTPDYHYGRTYSDSPSPRVMRQPFDPVTEATRATSPGSSDCSSYDYAASSASSYHAHYPSRQDPYSYQQHPEKRLSANSMAEPPSPQTSIASTSKESIAPKPARKNKYPCPFAASHACTATFTTSGHAARHGKKHTGEKSVHCPICNKAFTRKDNMKQHIRTHRTHSEDMSSNPSQRSPEMSREWETRRNNTLYDN